VYNFQVAELACYSVGRPGVLAYNDKSNEKADLIDAKARKHILDGDASGGGHRPGTGIPGKCEFPAGWSDDKILKEIADVATDSASAVRSGGGGRQVVEGTRDGVDIRVVIEPVSKGGRIVTGFPLNLPRNP
jgi:Bacterial EndoU nuclease